MDVVRICCKKCRKAINVQAAFAGQSKFCPRCGLTFVVTPIIETKPLIATVHGQATQTGNGPVQSELESLAAAVSQRSSKALVLQSAATKVPEGAQQMSAASASSAIHGSGGTVAGWIATVLLGFFWIVFSVQPGFDAFVFGSSLGAIGVTLGYLMNDPMRAWLDRVTGNVRPGMKWPSGRILTICAVAVLFSFIAMRYGW